jgi:HSP20 family molecular chaperone IbpA
MHRLTFEVVQQQLRVLHQALSELAACLPAVSFSPPLDVYEHDGEVVIEVALPGVPREDVHVDVTGNVVAVSGVRNESRPALHSELPRGAFRRVLVLPRGTASQPRIDVESGIVRIHLAQLQMSVAKA